MRDSEVLVIQQTGLKAIRGLYCIYVDGPAIAKNVAENRYDPVITIREASGETMTARDVWWNGPSRFVFRQIFLPGTTVQGWIETDSEIVVSDGEGSLKLLRPKNSSARVKMGLSNLTGMVRGDLVVHLDVPTLKKNREDGGDRPVIAVRKPPTLEEPIYAREAYWNGPSRILHRPTTPIPGTNGRGAAFVETDADVVIFNSDHGPQQL